MNTTPLLWSLAATAAFAQAPSPSTPSPPHERLRFFEGTWTAEPALQRDLLETCAWMPEGRRHMVCRSRWQTDAGPGERISIFSYDAKRDEYLYHGFRPGGAVVTHRGKPEGGGWMFLSEEGEGAALRRQRISIKPAAGGFELRAEEAKGGGAWVVTSTTFWRRVP